MTNILPDYIQDELMEMGQRSIADSWRIGDIANDLWRASLSLPKEKRIPKMQIYNEISLYVKKPSRTIRHYSRIAKFYNMESRSEYEQLSFEHFRLACDRPDWKDILEDAMDGLYETGKPKTVEALTRKYIYDIPEGAEERGGDQLLADILNGLFAQLENLLSEIDEEGDLTSDLISVKIKINKRIEDRLEYSTDGIRGIERSRAPYS